jgi:hypothetical protein
MARGVGSGALNLASSLCLILFSSSFFFWSLLWGESRVRRWGNLQLFLVSEDLKSRELVEIFGGETVLAEGGEQVLVSVQDAAVLKQFQS